MLTGRWHNEMAKAKVSKMIDMWSICDRYVIGMLAFAEVLADAKGFEDVGKLELGRAGQVASEFWACRSERTKMASH